MEMSRHLARHVVSDPSAHADRPAGHVFMPGVIGSVDFPHAYGGRAPLAFGNVGRDARKHLERTICLVALVDGDAGHQTTANAFTHSRGYVTLRKVRDSCLSQKKTTSDWIVIRALFAQALTNHPEEWLTDSSLGDGDILFCSAAADADTCINFTVLVDQRDTSTHGAKAPAADRRQRIQRLPRLY